MSAPTMSHPVLDLLLRSQRKNHLLTELTAAGMPGSSQAVGAADWAGILAWVEANLPAILGVITALIGLLG